jgi:hypothetical protein
MRRLATTCGAMPLSAWFIERMQIHEPFHRAFPEDGRSARPGCDRAWPSPGSLFGGYKIEHKSKTATLVASSSEPVGSSANRIFGLFISARQSAVR